MKKNICALVQKDNRSARWGSNTNRTHGSLAKKQSAPLLVSRTFQKLNTGPLKHSLAGVLMCLCLTLVLSGCNDTNHLEKSNNYTSEDLQAAKEEEEALLNMPKYSIMADEITKEFRDNDKLSYKEDPADDSVILKYRSTKGYYEFDYGVANDDEPVSTIYFTIYASNPVEDEALMKELTSTLKQLLTLLGEEYKEEIIIQALSDLTSTDNFTYSDTTVLYSDILEDNRTVDFRLYAR